MKVNGMPRKDKGGIFENPYKTLQTNILSKGVKAQTETPKLKWHCVWYNANEMKSKWWMMNDGLDEWWK